MSNFREKAQFIISQLYSYQDVLVFLCIFVFQTWLYHMRVMRVLKFSSLSKHLSSGPVLLTGCTHFPHSRQ